MIGRGFFAVAVFWVMTAMSLHGCARSPKATFYTLMPALSSEGGMKVAGGARSASVAVGPVTLPEMVDRPQLVVRAGESRVEILEMHRWAEPLKREIPRLLAEELSRRLGSTRVSAYSEMASADAQYRVRVDLQRFEATSDTVTVEGLWTVRRVADRGQQQGHSLVREGVSGSGNDAIVAAYRRALVKVGADLAQAVHDCIAASTQTLQPPAFPVRP